MFNAVALNFVTFSRFAPGGLLGLTDVTNVLSGQIMAIFIIAIGAAEAKKINKDENLIFSLLGDGELQEGQNWEAIMYASARKIDNLIATVDLNGKQIDGSTDDVLAMGSLKSKFEAFDWLVVEIDNGNDINEINV